MFPSASERRRVPGDRAVRCPPIDGASSGKKGDTVQRAILVILASAAAALMMGAQARAAQETIRITCWEGYADATIVKEFKDLVKEKYGIDVEVKAFYPTNQDEFSRRRWMAPLN